MPYDARSCMAMVSSLTGRWQATLIEPPVLTAALGATALFPGAALLPPPVPVLAAGAGVAAPPQAAMTALIDDIESPMTTPRFTNSRRLIRPRANDSTTSSCRGVVVRRTSSSLEKSMTLAPPTACWHDEPIRRIAPPVRPAYERRC